MNRRKALPYVLLACAAAAQRALALWANRDALLYRSGGLDAPQYLEMARGFVHGRWPADEPFFWAPGYPLLLGLLSRISEDATWLKAVQVVLGTASCALVGLVAARVFGDRRVTLASMAIAALYGPLVYYDLQVSPATLDVFLSLLLMVLLMHARGTAAWLAAGLVAAASAITRGAVLLFLPLVLIGLLRAATPARDKALAACAMIAPVLLALGLVAAHNHHGDRGTATDTSTRGLIPISYNLGINLWIGNVPALYAANHVEHPLSFLNYKAAVYEPVLYGVRRPSAQSRFLADKAGQFIVEHPGAWFTLMATKLGELVQGSEISRDTSIDASRLDNPVLAWLIWRRGIAFPSGLLIPLALLGIAFAPKRSAEHAWLLGALASQALFVLAFFVTTRYRLALWTLAIPYAAWTLVHATAAVRARSWRRPVVFCAAALGLLLFALSDHGLRPMPARHEAFEYDHLGHVLDRQGKHDDAVRQWQTAVAIDPHFASAHFQLALFYAKHGDAQRAESHFVAGLGAAPDTYAARLEYAKLLVAQARLQDAADQTRRVLARLPRSSMRQVVCAFARRSHLDVQGECA